MRGAAFDLYVPNARAPYIYTHACVKKKDSARGETTYVYVRDEKCITLCIFRGKERLCFCFFRMLWDTWALERNQRS